MNATQTRPAHPRPTVIGARVRQARERQRMSRGTLATKAGIYLLSRLLGHSTIAMSARYLRTFQQGRAVAAQRAAFQRVR